MTKLNEKQGLFVASMGKLLRVTAMFDSDEDANQYMAAHNSEAVVACFGHFVLLANVHDKGLKTKPGTVAQFWAEKTT